MGRHTPNTKYKIIRNFVFCWILFRWRPFVAYGAVKYYKTTWYIHSQIITQRIVFHSDRASISEKKNNGVTNWAKQMNFGYSWIKCIRLQLSISATFKISVLKVDDSGNKQLPISFQCMNHSRIVCFIQFVLSEKVVERTICVLFKNLFGHFLLIYLLESIYGSEFAASKPTMKWSKWTHMHTRKWTELMQNISNCFHWNKIKWNILHAQTGNTVMGLMISWRPCVTMICLMLKCNAFNNMSTEYIHSCIIIMALSLYMLCACKRCTTNVYARSGTLWGRWPQRTYKCIICQMITPRLHSIFNFSLQCLQTNGFAFIFGIFPISTEDRKISHSFHSFPLLRSIKSTLAIC